ncbi:MAG TPA: type 4a pilus biogenesis protein PilO [Candidatus Ozemobacteraceae bacterium]|nr:type 4a pilus biogenesis protein PilO [Candidatus Ozemobacteraceae bacterium]
MAEEFKLQEWLVKAKDDPKLAAQPVVVLLAIVFLGWKFLYSPQKLIYEKELKKNKAVQSEINGLESAVANIEEIKIEVNDLKQSRLAAEELCYKKAEAPQFLQDLRKLAKQAGLDLKSINPQPPVARSFETVTFEEYPVKISFTGDFVQLGTFLRILEQHKKIVSIALPQLTPDASGTFKFDLVPTTVLLLEQKAPSPTDAPPPEGG